MEEEKYLMDCTKNKIVNDKILWRVVALKDFGDVKAGDLGGYIERYENLSQTGNCWIYEDSFVYGDAKVTEDAKIIHGLVFGNSVISGNTKIKGEIICNGAVTGYFPTANVQKLVNEVKKLSKEDYQMFLNILFDDEV